MVKRASMAYNKRSHKSHLTVAVSCPVLLDPIGRARATASKAKRPVRCKPHHTGSVGSQPHESRTTASQSEQDRRLEYPGRRKVYAMAIIDRGTTALSMSTRVANVVPSPVLVWGPIAAELCSREAPGIAKPPALHLRH